MNIFIKKINSLNPFILFLPYLLLFLMIVLKSHSDTMDGDEGRYYLMAQNLVNGFYSPPLPNINLWNGPGYPIFLMPFVLLKLPLISITLTNAFLQYFSIILLYYSILKYTNKTVALFFSFFWASYYIAYQELALILTEPFSSFLITLVIYFLSRLNSENNKKPLYSVLLGITFGFLVLTKIIIGYVLLLLILITLLVWLRYSDNIKKKFLFISMVIAFGINIPYLLYTYSITNKLMYWSNAGGMSLYWMSTPYEGEFGDWNNIEFTANCGHAKNIPCNADLISKNHKEDMDYITSLPIVDQDDAYKKIAVKNIKNNPVKYIRNCASNLGRLFFGIPASYFYQREETLARFPPNCFVVVFILFSFCFTAVNIKKINFEIIFIAVLFLSYLFVSTLVSAYPRQLSIVVPLILFWTAYIGNKSIRLTYCLSD
jgi:4-amino-4-deoxy-L-arabinose transferase-like glycosyltransferase